MNSKTEERLKSRYREFRDGFVRGVGWSFGVTVGFVLISTLLVFMFNSLGGVPLIGEGIASIVAATQESLLTKSVIAPR